LVNMGGAAFRISRGAYLRRLVMAKLIAKVLMGSVHRQLEVAQLG